jgi:hypothetical protein
VNRLLTAYRRLRDRYPATAVVVMLATTITALVTSLFEVVELSTLAIPAGAVLALAVVLLYLDTRPDKNGGGS